MYLHLHVAQIVLFAESFLTVNSCSFESTLHSIDVKNVDLKNKNVKTRFLFKKNKNVKKRWWQIRKILFKPDEKVSSKITILVCMTMFESYGSSEKHFLQLPC